VSKRHPVIFSVGVKRVAQNLSDEAADEVGIWYPKRLDHFRQILGREACEVDYRIAEAGVAPVDDPTEATISHQHVVGVQIPMDKCGYLVLSSRNLNCSFRYGMLRWVLGKQPNLKVRNCRSARLLASRGNQWHELMSASRTVWISMFGRLVRVGMAYSVLVGSRTFPASDTKIGTKHDSTCWRPKFSQMKSGLSTLISVTLTVSAALGSQGQVTNTKLKDNDGATPLMKAAHAGDLEQVRALLVRGADVNARSKTGATALMVAAFGGHADCVMALTSAKADVNAKTKFGITALVSAAQTGHTDCLKALIAAHADVNEVTMGGSTALSFAASLSYIDCVKALIKAHADVNAKAHDGKTALMGASDMGHLTSVEALIAARANVNARDKRGGTAVMGAALMGHTDCVKLLVAHQADLNARTVDGCTALTYAILMGRSKSVELLIASHVDLRTKDGEGRTPVSLARQNPEHMSSAAQRTILELLSAAGAKG
jgi:ankyrin repeat protein